MKKHVLMFKVEVETDTDEPITQEQIGIIKRALEWDTCFLHGGVEIENISFSRNATADYERLSYK